MPASTRYAELGAILRPRRRSRPSADGGAAAAVAAGRHHRSAQPRRAGAQRRGAGRARRGRARARRAPVTPVVVKSSAGATERMRIARVGNLLKTIDSLRERGVRVLGRRYRAAGATGPRSICGPDGAGRRRRREGDARGGGAAMRRPVSYPSARRGRFAERVGRGRDRALRSGAPATKALNRAEFPLSHPPRPALVFLEGSAAMTWGLLLQLGAGAMALTGYAIGWWFEPRRRARRALTRVQEARLADLRDGDRARVTGIARATDETTTSPIGQRSCIGFHVVVEEKTSGGAGANWHTLLVRSHCLPVRSRRRRCRGGGRGAVRPRARCR